jgi:hypothetical protein
VLKVEHVDICLSLALFIIILTLLFFTFLVATTRVPRAYADLGFLNDLVEDAIPQVAKSIKVPGIFKWAFGLQQKISEAIQSTITKEEALIEVAAYFRHIGKVIYYKSHDAAPEVYIDKGAFYRKPEGSNQKLFRDIKYVASNDVIKSAKDNHLFLVTGPGLAYNVKREEL